MDHLVRRVLEVREAATAPGDRDKLVYDFVGILAGAAFFVVFLPSTDAVSTRVMALSLATGCTWWLLRRVYRAAALVCLWATPLLYAFSIVISVAGWFGDTPPWPPKDKRDALPSTEPDTRGSTGQ